MEFGIALPTYPSGATVEGFTKVAQAAERLGFVSAWATDHVIMPPEQAGPYRDIFEALMSLAYLAGQTSTVKLGVSVLIVPQRNGIIQAKQIATLDNLSNGRVIMGVGAGWTEAEFDMLGYAERFHHRGAFLNETLRVWQHLWTSPDTPFKGRFYDLPPVAFGPGPVQEGGPAIWVGGPSEAARRRAGRYGAAWHPVGISAEDLAEKAKLVFETAAKAGRPEPKLVPRLPMWIGEQRGGQMTASRMRVLQGEPEQLVEQLKAYEKAGASEIVCLFGSPEGDVVIEQMETFHREVMPALKG